MPQEIPPEVQQKIGHAVAAVKELNEDGLRAALTDFGVYVEENATKGYMRKKLKYMEQQRCLEEAGLKETPKMTEQHAVATDTLQTEADGEKKPGRKRMDKSGTFAIDLGEGGSLGRDGSAKHGIMKQLSDLERPFSYEEFVEAVKVTMQWDAEKETFGRSTKFPSLNACAGAWFSELKNKAKVLVKVEGAG